MELTQALDILKRLTDAKQKELDSLELAVSVLEERFSPQLRVLETAKQAVVDKEKVIMAMSVEMMSVASAKSELEAKVSALEKIILTPTITEEEPAPATDTEFVEDAPIEDAPVEDAPVEDAPIEDAPVEDAPVEDAPIEDAPIEDAPVEDAPVEVLTEATLPPSST